MTIKVPPKNKFDERPFGGKWFLWAEIEECFWPGHGIRSESINPLLSKVKDLGGVYFLAWSVDAAPTSIISTEERIKYIGQTNFFKGRMGQFATSAGFWGKRDSGHSAGWRWPEGSMSDLYVAFFPIGENENAHIAEGIRHWVEATALDAYCDQYGELPEINRIRAVAVFSVDQAIIKPG